MEKEISIGSTASTVILSDPDPILELRVITERDLVLESRSTSEPELILESRGTKPTDREGALVGMEGDNGSVDNEGTVVTSDKVLLISLRIRNFRRPDADGVAGQSSSALPTSTEFTEMFMELATASLRARYPILVAHIVELRVEGMLLTTHTAPVLSVGC